MKTKTFKARFTLESEYDIEVEAIDEDDALEQFEAISCENHESIIDRGNLRRSHLSDWDMVRPVSHADTDRKESAE